MKTSLPDLKKLICFVFFFATIVTQTFADFGGGTDYYFVVKNSNITPTGQKVYGYYAPDVRGVNESTPEKSWDHIDDPNNNDANWSDNFFTDYWEDERYWYPFCKAKEDCEFVGWTHYVKIVGDDNYTTNSDVKWGRESDLVRKGDGTIEMGGSRSGTYATRYIFDNCGVTRDTIWAVILPTGRKIEMTTPGEMSVFAGQGASSKVPITMTRKSVPFEVKLDLSGDNAFDISTSGNDGDWHGFPYEVPSNYVVTDAYALKTTTLYVRLKSGLSAGTYEATMTTSTDYVEQATITLHGEVKNPTLTLSEMTPSTLANDGEGTVTLSGSNLGGTVVVSLSGGANSKFQIKTDESSWGTSLNIDGSGLSTETLHVRINPNVVGLQNNFSEQLSATASPSGVSATPITIKGSVTPTLTLSETEITGMVDYEERTFTISGTRLSGNVTVTPPTGFQIKYNSVWQNEASIPSTSINNSSVTLPVRMSGVGSHIGSIMVASSEIDGSLQRYIAVSGTVADTWVNQVPANDDFDATCIASPEDLAWFISLVNGCNGQVANPAQDGHITADIDLAGHPWVPLNGYTGTLDGHGHVISGLTNKIGDNAATDPGMFVSIAGGTVKNVVVQDCDFVASTSVANFGIIANQMSNGTIHSCVSQSELPMVHTLSGGTICNSLANMGTLYASKEGSGTAKNCIYKNGSDWKYVKSDGSEAAITIQGFDYGEKGCVHNGSTERLVDVLNKYAKPNSYSLWAQPLTTGINEGVPVLKMEGFNTVAQNDGFLYYGNFNTLDLTGYVLFYGKESNVTKDYTGDNLYIDEDAALKVAEGKTVKAHTSRFIANLPSKETEIWHHYSSPVTDAATGITYNQTGQMQPGVSCEPQLGAGLFPSGTYIANNDNVNWDLYSYYEPAYHWLNFKRNALSHYKNGDAPQELINLPGDLRDQSKLRNGEGYLIALASSSYIQSTGNLNHGEITKAVTVSNLSGTVGDGLQGLNLLGNPYQSYLSFKAFADGNAGLWNGIATYLTYNPQEDSYTQGSVETTSLGSAAASGDISMHQGFFIVAKTAGTATFTDDMCSVNPDDGNVHFRGGKFAYPLVNLVVRDGEGVGDVAVVEFDRPEFAAAPKIFNYGGKGKVYFSYENEDDALLFLSEAIDQLPIHFDAFEDGDYTLSWSTANADFSYLHLIDNIMGADIDMLAHDSYSFSATTADYKSRFKMKFAYTGIGEDTDAEPAKAFAFVHDGNLVVNGQGILDIIDMNGRTICNQKLTGEQNTIGLPNVAPGVYVVRIVNSNESNVQKIIIK